MPEGVDTIVMHEKCKRSNNRVIINEKVNKSKYETNRRKFKKGEVVVKKGKLLNAADIGQLAASGNNKIDIYEKLNVSVISTGDELISSKQQKIRGQIYDSNKPMLLSLLDHKFLNIHDFGIVKDNRNELAKNLLMPYQRMT